MGRKQRLIRVQIPGYAWLEALKEPFIVDNEGWFEQRVSRNGTASWYVAKLDPERARLLGSALEHRAVMSQLGNTGWALRRAAIRIEADINVED